MKGLAESYVNDRKAQTQGAMVAVSLVVALVVASLVAAFLLPIGIDEIIAVDTAAWSDGATAMWDILDVLTSSAGLKPGESSRWGSRLMPNHHTSDFLLRRP